MHILQSKHLKLKSEEVKALLIKYNLTISQLPKIKFDDVALPEGAKIGDIIKLERKEEDGSTTEHFRVVA